MDWELADVLDQIDKDLAHQRREMSKSARRENPESSILSNLRYKSRKLGLPFDLELKDLVPPDICPVLGIKLERGLRDKDTSPSVDRLIPSRGYTKDNVRIISNRANRIKNNGTLDELKKIVAYMEEQIK